MYILHNNILQMANRDIVCQEILCFEAIFKQSKLVDQFCDGLRNAGILKAIRAFPDLFVRLFTYTGDISSKSVLEAIKVDDGIPKKLMEFLTKFNLKAHEKGN